MSAFRLIAFSVLLVLSLATQLPLAQAQVVNRELSVQDFARNERLVKFLDRVEKLEKAGYNKAVLPYVILPTTPVKQVVVAVHGLSDSPYVLREALEPLAQKPGTAIIGVLLSGHGKPATPTAPEDFTLATLDPTGLHDAELSDWRRDVKEALDLAQSLVSEGGEISYVGYSMGAALGVDASLRYPKLIKRAVLIAPMFEINDWLISIAGVAYATRLKTFSHKSTGGSFFTYSSTSTQAAYEGYKLTYELDFFLYTMQSPTSTKFAVIGTANDQTIKNGPIMTFIEQRNVSPRNVYFIPHNPYDDTKNVEHRHISVRCMTLCSPSTPPEKRNLPNPAFGEVQNRIVDFLK